MNISSKNVLKYKSGIVYIVMLYIYHALVEIRIEAE